MYNKLDTLKRVLKDEKISLKIEEILTLVLFMTFSTIIGSMMPRLYSLFTDEVMMNKNAKVFPQIILLMFLLFLVKSLVDYVGTCSWFRYEKKLINGLKAILLKRIVSQHISKTQKESVGNLYKLLNQDSVMVSKLLIVLMVKIPCNIVFLLFYVCLMFKLSAILTIITLIVYPVFYVAVSITSKKFDDIKEKLWKENSDNMSLVFEFVTKWKEVKSNCLEKKVLDIYRHKQYAEKNTNLKWMLLFSINSLMCSMKNDLFQKMIVYIVGSILILNGRITVGTLLMYLSYVSTMNLYVDSVVEFVYNFTSERNTFNRVFEVLIKNKEQINTLPEKDELNLEMSDVSFAYPNIAENLLESVCINFRQGKKYLILGKSGIGKSTMVNLLKKKEHCQKGEICINDYSIDLYSDRQYYKMFGFVSRENVFFNFSIEENLRLFDESISKQDIIKACQIAGIHDHINALPEGYKTIIGEGGTKMSGGQRQRLAIARVVLHNPKVVVFDEATSSIDVVTEKCVYENLQRIYKKKIWIVISHKQNMPIDFDDTLYLANKKLIKLKDIDKDCSKDEFKNE